MRLNQLLPAAVVLAVLTAQWGTPGGDRSHPGRGPAAHTANRTSHITRRAARRYTRPPPGSTPLEWTGPARNNSSAGTPGIIPGVLPHEEPE